MVVISFEFGVVEQECQTCRLLGAILHVGNRAEGCIMFFNLDITTSPGNGLCNVACSKVNLKKKVITSPASPHHHLSSGIINQKLSSGCLKKDNGVVILER